MDVSLTDQNFVDFKMLLHRMVLSLRDRSRNPQPKIRALKRLRFFWCRLLVQNKPMIYGYARVSTGSQSEAAQVVTLKKHGAGKEMAKWRRATRSTIGRSLPPADLGKRLRSPSLATAAMRRSRPL